MTTKAEVSVEEQSVQGETLPQSSGPWLCFHCDELFTDRAAAADHFGNGDYEAEVPMCIQAATTEQKELIRTAREMWEEIRKAHDENDDFECQLSSWAYTARKLTGKPSATSHDVEHEWDFMQGRVIAAESAINAAPNWLQWLLRWKAGHFQKFGPSGKDGDNAK